MLDQFQGTKPQMDIERAVYFTRSMRETDGKMLVLRWALAMKNVAENMTVYVDDNNLLAGRGGKFKRYGILYPELYGSSMEQTLDDLSERASSSFDISAEDIDVLRAEIAPYWKNHSFYDNFVKSLPEETLKISYDPMDLTKNRFLVNETATVRASLQWVPDYEKAIKKGFKAIAEEAQQRLDEMDPLEYKVYGEKRQFLEAIVIECNAIIHWAKRHAAEALRQAALTNDPVRKKELEEIAERCNWVPEHPARNFAEAVQAHWFTALFHRLEFNTGTTVSNGRMDQFLYPYYKADIENGTLTEKKAMEILECLWVTMAQCTDLKFICSAIYEGYAHWEAVTVGGLTKDGQDATNELTYLMLRSKQEFNLDYPDLAARIHKNSPEKYLREVAKTIRAGSGYPKLFNDEEIIPHLTNKGFTVEEASDYAASGCTEVRVPNKDTFTCCCSLTNAVAPLELVFYNGKTLATGDELIGLETGTLDELATWEDFWQAYRAQLENFLQHGVVQLFHAHNLRENYFASPLSDCLHDACMNACKDLHSKVIPGGIDVAFVDLVGVGTVADSLTAIKKLVYDDKKITLQELVEALKCNFEGKEVIRQMLIHAPKFGNNDLYADNIVKDIEAIAIDMTNYAEKIMHIDFDVRYSPVTSHVPFGAVVGATPDGRKAGVALSDGLSASQGADLKGPTAVLLSQCNSRIECSTKRAARLLNLRFTPSALQGEEGLSSMVDFIRSWCDLKIWFVQFNVINTETLKEAQREPEKYKTLLVRVAGYSAYFTDLTQSLQNDIITRTAHEGV